nr:hypothetical protein [Kibdelosporangium aridum]
MTTAVARGLGAPQGVDEAFGGNHLVGVRQQDGEQLAVSRLADAKAAAPSVTSGGPRIPSRIRSDQTPPRRRALQEK